MRRLIHLTMLNPNAMPFKLNLSPASGFALPGHTIIHVQGLDSQAFLQAQCMNDVNALVDGRWQYNGWLNPQGRVLALFYLARLAPEHFMIILPALNPDTLIDGLKRFVFRSKVVFTLTSNLFAQGHIGSAITENTKHTEITGTSESGYQLSIADTLSCRLLMLKHESGNGDSSAQDQWHSIDMASGWVWIDESLQNLWTPQMLSLQRLDAYSLKKGCYPGQEIVARTHYLGKSKRHLQAVIGADLESGQCLFQDNHEIGKIVNANLAGDYAVAVLPVDLNAAIAVMDSRKSVLNVVVS